MSAFTRRTHIVRCSDPDNSDRWADVEVLDAVSFVGKNGMEEVMDMRVENAVPYIEDETGGGSGRDPPEPTRASHMVKLVNPNDATQFFNGEVLDRCAFVTTNGQTWVMNAPSREATTVIENGEIISGGGPATRSVNIKRISNPDNPAEFIKVARPNAISFISPNGETMVLAMPIRDMNAFTTPENYDPIKHPPPKNRDPNPYIKWTGGGPWLGNKIISQGPLWWIRNVSGGGNNLWYWYRPAQQPMQWSGKTDVLPCPQNDFSKFLESWHRLPNFGRSHGFVNCSNYNSGAVGLGPPIPPVGYDTLEAAILNGTITQDWFTLDFTVNDPGDPAVGRPPAFIPGVSGSPDLWQITDIAPPEEDPVTHTRVVSPALAAQVAAAYLQQWTQTSDNANDDQIAIDGPIPEFPNNHVHFPFPTTTFHVPLKGGDQSFGGPGSFFGGIDPGYWFSGGEMFAFQPTYASYIAVGQLDPLRWDTTNPLAPKLRPGQLPLP